MNDTRVDPVHFTGDIYEIDKLFALSQLDIALNSLYDKEPGWEKLDRAIEHAQRVLTNLADGSIEKILFEGAKQVRASRASGIHYDTLRGISLIIQSHMMVDDLYCIRRNAEFLYLTSAAYRYLAEQYESQ